MSMFYILSSTEVVQFPSHLHTDIQVDVTLRTYIEPILFTNFCSWLWAQNHT